MYYPVFIVIGILFCIWFLLPFFTKRILNPGNITGISFSVLMILCGILKNTVLIYFLLFCLLCALFFTMRIFSVMCKRPTASCTVIVLGCRVYGTKASLMLEERFKERPGTDLIDIDVNIYCERESHKGMVIGKGGAMLKKIASAARADCEEFLGCRVNLQCWVKVKSDWRDNEFLLNNFGFKQNNGNR